MENVIANTSKLGSSNDEKTLNVIRRQGPIARIDIAKITNLTPATISNITTKLLELGLIVEDHIGESRGGRRPLLLKVNHLLAAVIIIYIASEKVTGYVLDPQYKILGKDSKIIKDKKKEDILEIILHIIHNCRKMVTVSVRAAGVVLCDSVRTNPRIAAAIPAISWESRLVKEMIEAKAGLPVIIEDDVKALSNEEYNHGSVKDTRNMILVKVSRGISSSIILNGKIYRGVTHSAGEIGHTTIDIAGPKCSCGNYGCLEALASEAALVNTVVKAIKEGQDSSIYNMTDGRLENVTPEMIYEAANHNDEVAIRTMRQAARYLGIGIANFVNLFNPEIVAIDGGIVNGRQYIEDVIRQTITARSFESCNSFLKIRFLTTTIENTIKGAADIVFAEFTRTIWLDQRNS